MGTKSFQSAFGKRPVMPLPNDYGVRAEGAYFTDPRGPYKKKEDRKERKAAPSVVPSPNGSTSKINQKFYWGEKA